MGVEARQLEGEDVVKSFTIGWKVVRERIIEKNNEVVDVARRTVWLCSAHRLEYQLNHKIYACNGVPLTLFVQAASKERTNTLDSIPQDILRAIISAVAILSKPLELLGGPVLTPTLTHTAKFPP